MTSPYESLNFGQPSPGVALPTFANGVGGGGIPVSPLVTPVGVVNDATAVSAQVPGAAGGSPGLWSSFNNWLQGPNSLGSTGVEGTTPDWLHGIIGTKEAPGWGNLAVGAGGALMSGFLGLQQYGLAKQALAQSKQQFETNFAAQRSTTNAQLEDRQRARVASSPGAYQSVGDYMNHYGIK